MKLIVAVFAPEKLESVQAALNDWDASLLSISQVLGDGREPGYREVYRGVEVRVRRPKLRVEITADDWCVDAVVEAIGRLSGGKVFVMPLDTSRVRSDMNSAAPAGVVR